MTRKIKRKKQITLNLKLFNFQAGCYLATLLLILTLSRLVARSGMDDGDDDEDKKDENDYIKTVTRNFSGWMTTLKMKREMKRTDSIKTFVFIFQAGCYLATLVLILTLSRLVARGAMHEKKTLLSPGSGGGNYNSLDDSGCGGEEDSSMDG